MIEQFLAEYRPHILIFIGDLPTHCTAAV